jgi:outer membrane protein
MKIFLSTLLLSQGLLFAQTYTLKDSYEHAIKYNKSLKIYAKKVAIEKKNIDITESLLKPSVKLTYNANHYFDTSTTQQAYSGASSSHDTVTADLSASQKIYDHDSSNKHAKSKISYKKTLLDYEAYKQQLIIIVSEVYLEILFMEENYQLTIKKQETLQQQLADIKKRFDLGEATVQDLTDVQSRYQLALHEKIEAYSDLNIQKEKFKVLTGIELSINDTLKDITLQTKNYYLNDKNSYISNGYENNIDIKIKEMELLLNKQELANYEGEFYPKVNFTTGRNYYNTDDSISTTQKYETRQSYFSLQFELPIYSGNETEHKIVQAKDNINLKKLELSSAKDELRYKIISEFLNINKFKIQVESLKVALKSAQTTLEASKVGFNFGSRTHFEVLEAIEAYYSIKNSINSVKYKFALSILKLKMFSGNIEQKDLQIQ